MKDLLKTFIYSIFKFFLNPNVWSNVYANVNTTAQPIQTQSIDTVKIQSITNGEPDIRDINLGKALDLANNRIRLALLESTSNQSSLGEVTTSSMQLLSIEESSDKSGTSADDTKSDVLDQSDQSNSNSSVKTNEPVVEVFNATVETVAVDEDNASFRKTNIEVVKNVDKSTSSDNSDNSDFVVL